MDNLGIRLKVARIKSGLNQSQAVEELSKLGEEMSQSYLSKIENNIHEPSLGQLKTFAKVYRVDVLELLYSEQELRELRQLNK